MAGPIEGSGDAGVLVDEPVEALPAHDGLGIGRGLRFRWTCLAQDDDLVPESQEFEVALRSSPT